MRGPPGCGKSTAARSLLSQHLGAQAVQWHLGRDAAFSPICRAFILSTDDYFTEVDEAGRAVYKFEPKLLGQHHKRNQLRCELAMELGLTPLFVDNTNVALWEMRAYVQLADRFGYAARILDPRGLGPGALDPEVLFRRCSREGAAGSGRAAGKDIDFSILERMSKNFEELPTEVGEATALEAVRQALAPWERREKLPLYAGLDVEARALAALGSVQLGPHFWGERQLEEGTAPSGGHLFDARYQEDCPWLLPDRLHVTVQFFGGRTKKSDILEAEALVGSWHEVTVNALVFIKGGGILCADVHLPGEGAGRLRELAGEGWRPHITLLTARPWRAMDSTALLNAWGAAKVRAGLTRACSTQSETTLVESTQIEATQVESTQGDAVVEELSAAEAQPAGASPVEVGQSAARPTDAEQTDGSRALPTVAGLTGTETGDIALSVEDPGVTPMLAASVPTFFDCEEVDASSLVAQLPNLEPNVSALAPLAYPACDGPTDVFHDVLVNDRLVDLCVIPLQPPRPLGLCRFRFFN